MDEVVKENSTKSDMLHKGDNSIAFKDWEINFDASKYYFKNLMEYLKCYFIQNYYDGIVYNIFHPKYRTMKSLRQGIVDWTVEEVFEWLKSLHFLDNQNEIIANKCKYEWINGKCFMDIKLPNWLGFGFNPLHFLAVSCVIKGWLEDWSPPNSEIIPVAMLNSSNDKIFGQLVVLGYKEYRSDKSNEAKKSIGSSNQKDTSDLNNQNRKIFKIGRSSNQELGNDIIIHGHVHINSNGLLSGPISRQSCQIECDIYTNKCYIYGSNTKYENSTVIKISEFEDDVVTYFGIKLYNPKLGVWYEISSNGNCFSVRQGKDQIGIKLSDAFTNELINGSIIDLYGICLLYQSNEELVKQQSINPMKFLNELNLLKPQCPVLMHTLHFTYHDQVELKVQEMLKLEQQGVGYIPVGDIHIPTNSVLCNDDSRRTFVFPSCGHVHGFHQSLVGKSCPLCRKPGVFVPIIFPFEIAICHKKPSHVFNPCGHVASKKVCQYWSKIPMYSYNTQGEIIDCKPCCPYCHTALNREGLNGGPFNRLILQTEQGDIWEKDNDSDEDVNIMKIEELDSNKNNYIKLQTYKPNSNQSKDNIYSTELSYIIDKTKL